MTKSIDCVVCGSCVMDLLCRPVRLDEPIGHGRLHPVGPIEVAAGGITSNAGVTMARLGASVAVYSYVGKDVWGEVIHTLYQREGIDASPIREHPTLPTSTTVVAIDASGERSFFHCVGAPRELDARSFLDRLDFFARCRFMLLGYYSLLPYLENDLPGVLERLREVGCKTAMDAAGDGGTIKPLDRILPRLDVYVPSLDEACHQTGLPVDEDPRRIIEVFRRYCPGGLLGVKLGKNGVLLSPAAKEFIQIDAVAPPGAVVDTTGAGDSFYGGLLAGLARGCNVEQAGRLGAAAAACCVTTLGGSAGGKDYAATAALAGLHSDD